jgi:hypothetical protein
MPRQTELGDMVKYQFEIDDGRWEKWKNTVPRSKSLEERIIELIEADTEGRVEEKPASGGRSSGHEPRGKRPEDTPPEPSPTTPESHAVRDEAEHVLRGLGLPGRGDDLEARVEALLAMHDLLREREGERVNADQLKDIADEYAHGYADAGSFWSNCVKKNSAQERPNALKALPGVREVGSGEYTYERDGA